MFMEFNDEIEKQLELYEMISKPLFPIAICHDERNITRLLDKGFFEVLPSNTTKEQIVNKLFKAYRFSKDVIEKLGIKNQEDPKLQEATNELYKTEHNKGRIREDIPEFAGESVVTARNEIRDQMLENNQAGKMYDFSERPVICRCGERCVVKVMDNQWFLRYSDESWKDMIEGNEND